MKMLIQMRILYLVINIYFKLNKIKNRRRRKVDKEMRNVPLERERFEANASTEDSIDN